MQKCNRRSFLKRVGGAVALPMLAPASALGLDGKVALLAWTNETDWTSASYTVKEEKAASHAFTWQVVQGADTNARAYVANVAWSPADTDMRAITLSVEPAEGARMACGSDMINFSQGFEVRKGVPVRVVFRARALPLDMEER